MNSRDFLTINGARNSNDFGLYVDTPPMWRMAEQKTTVLDIPDREESLYITHDEYEDVVMPVTAYTFSNSFDISSVYEWLRKAKRISFNSNPTRFFKVKKLRGITPNYSGNGKNVFTIEFVVSPFRYFVDDPNPYHTDKEFTVSNDGNYYCRPVYEIHGSGVISIENDTEKLVILGDKDNSGNYKGVEGNCVIDSERLIIYKIDGDTKKILKTEGIIPLLYSGNNHMQIEGNMSSISINRNQRDV